MRHNFLVGVLLMTAITLMLAGCDMDEENNGGGAKSPEQQTPQERWDTYTNEESTATIAISVGDDDVCTITVGGTAVLPEYNRWHTNAHYTYTAAAGARYLYTFEAWTESDEREIKFQYYNNGTDEMWIGTHLSITEDRETYEILGETIPKAGIHDIEFQCADQLGTFYVKIISITQVTAATAWDTWSYDDTTATVGISVAADGVCTVTVGGAASEVRWHVDARYEYAAEAYTTYIYTFEAWTQSGERELNVQYYGDGDSNQYWEVPVSITDKRETYTVVGETIPKDGVRAIGFQGADQLGIFYVKIISIERATPTALWNGYVNEETDATLNFSLDSEGVCTVIVGGTPEADEGSRWHTNAHYAYGAVQGARYWYDFYAWTDGEDREIFVQYYNGGDTGPWPAERITITSEKKTYGFEGASVMNDSVGNEHWFKSGNRNLEFQCADQTGTFYVKINNISRID